MREADAIVSADEAHYHALLRRAGGQPVAPLPDLSEISDVGSSLRGAGGGDDAIDGAGLR